mmetsp:Transcript_41905/g.50254  ORF Transcript_41905/g.50254 Transcript_41905/m.50254 type:complete len:106 (+) Transcript_41905:385-702(+)
MIDAKGGTSSWARKTVGVRMPDDPVLSYIQGELNGLSLLVSSIPHDDDDGNAQTRYLDFDAGWYNNVDFIVDAGERPVDGSTIFDLTAEEPELLREGIGDVSLSF